MSQPDGSQRERGACCEQLPCLSLLPLQRPSTGMPSEPLVRVDATDQLGAYLEDRLYRQLAHDCSKKGHPFFAWLLSFPARISLYLKTPQSCREEHEI